MPKLSEFWRRVPESNRQGPLRNLVVFKTTGPSNVPNPPWYQLPESHWDLILMRDVSSYLDEAGKNLTHSATATAAKICGAATTTSGAAAAKSGEEEQDANDSDHLHILHPIDWMIVINWSLFNYITAFTLTFTLFNSLVHSTGTNPATSPNRLPRPPAMLVCLHFLSPDGGGGRPPLSL